MVKLPRRSVDMAQMQVLEVALDGIEVRKCGEGLVVDVGLDEMEDSEPRRNQGVRS